MDDGCDRSNSLYVRNRDRNDGQMNREQLTGYDDEYRYSSQFSHLNRYSNINFNQNVPQNIGQNVGQNVGQSVRNVQNIGGKLLSNDVRKQNNSQNYKKYYQPKIIQNKNEYRSKSYKNNTQMNDKIIAIKVNDEYDIQNKTKSFENKSPIVQFHDEKELKYISKNSKTGRKQIWAVKKPPIVSTVNGTCVKNNTKTESNPNLISNASQPLHTSSSLTKDSTHPLNKYSILLVDMDHDLHGMCALLNSLQMYAVDNDSEEDEMITHPSHSSNNTTIIHPSTLKELWINNSAKDITVLFFFSILLFSCFSISLFFYFSNFPIFPILNIFFFANICKCTKKQKTKKTKAE